MSRNEGQLVNEKEIAILKARFDKIDESCRAKIMEISEEAYGAISMNPPTERRVGIARILLEISEQDGYIDKDLVRSICELRMGKQYSNAGLALADLSWNDAERVWSTFLDIYAERVELEYIPVSNTYITKEKTKHVR